MIQVGKLFQKVPYYVRDLECEYKIIHDIEEIVDEFLSNYMMTTADLYSVFSNNRDSSTNLHLVFNDGAMPKISIHPDFEHDVFDISFEELKDSKNKTTKVNSLMFIEEFQNRKEEALAKTFDEIMGCDGEELFISLKQEKLDMFNPSSANFDHRVNLITKKELILEVCKLFDISSIRLYKQLNPNIVKHVCKDLNITYKILAKEIGYKPDTINKAASLGKVSEQLNKAINMYLENLRLKEFLKDFDVMKSTLKKILD
ncbi:hypothetical protein [Arcobacter sp. F2176]|uniref:hypothetical protein n=1 Tax=Arcobacter sp. F2176 TaxID=2044511 RepID=UPI002159DD3B|nr:hypothetical protein [Arcobacter sp. F2176]